MEFTCAFTSKQRKISLEFHSSHSVETRNSGKIHLSIFGDLCDVDSVN